MKISDFFDITKFGGVIAAGVLAAAIIFIIQLGLSNNNKLVKLEVEFMQLSEETNEKFGKIDSKLDNITNMLKVLQPLLERFNELEQRVEVNENEIVGFQKSTEYLKGQVETILSSQ